MLNWSVVKAESLQYQKLPNKITMTLFAVVKEKEQDRLIRWPRIQNEHMSKPPYVDLPAPDLFTIICMDSSTNVLGFFFDIANM